MQRWAVGLLAGAWALVLGGGLALEQWWVLALPFGLAFVALCILRLDAALLVLAALTPLSVLIDDPSLGFAVQIPTDPMMLVISAVLVGRWLWIQPPSKALLTHPITLILVLWTLWMVYTIPASSSPWVSLKFVLSNTWKVLPCYFGAILLFQKNRNILVFWWLYLIPLAFVAAWSLYQHANDGFTKEASYWASEPFVINHGIYGAMLAFLIPLVVLYLIKPQVLGSTARLRPLFLALLVLLTIAVIMSYTRAAWVSLAAAMGFWLVLVSGLRFRWLMTVIVLVTVLVALNSGPLLMFLMRNKTDSQDRLDKHLQSISNVRSDASNLERLNRWAAGLRMFQERPWLGWGPGTYMLQYAPYQNPYQKTIISTNNADVGGIHSEYFGPLVETGVPGFLLFASLVLASLQRSMVLWRRLKNPEHQRERALSLAAVLGLVTYYTHGLLNNYLDMDKTALLFWSMLAVLVALDLKTTPPKQPT